MEPAPPPKPSRLGGFAWTALAGAALLLLVAALPGSDFAMEGKTAFAFVAYPLIVIGILGMTVLKLKGSPFHLLMKVFIGVTVGTVALVGTLLLVIVSCLARSNIRF